MSHEFNWFGMPDWAKAANQAAERANRMQQEQLAREWADYAKNCEVSSPEQQAAADFILANTKSPTVAEIGWDNAQHRRRVAVDEGGVEWVMLYQRRDGMILEVRHDLAEVRGLRPDRLTPNGKRYELREVTVSQDENVADDQPEHPKWLRTTEDYENAPEFTIVCEPGGAPAMKLEDDMWVIAGMYGPYGSGYLAKSCDESMEVMRWGDGQ